jgi:septal ring factor EnvC (AmiA/AmiB activator)
MDVDIVLLSVRERDNWRRRLELLEQTLDEIRGRRSQMESRMKRLKKDLQKLAKAARASVPSSSRPSPTSRIIHAPDAQLPGR